MIAMHIPDGFIDGPTSLVAGLIAIAGVAWCVRKSSATLSDREIPVVGLAAAFIFAAQMLNFPVANGTSGHLLGGVLAAVLVGPYAGALAVTVVLVVQALLFADGGLTAIGLNVLNMGVVGTFTAFGVTALLLKVLPRTNTGVVVTSWVAAVVSVVVASQAFVVEYALGGTTSLPVLGIAVTMAGVHVLIGIGEGLITAITVGTVAKVRPDLVYALRGRARRQLDIRTNVPVGGGAA
jgi:cobalt/nickel transport system permease protein